MGQIRSIVHGCTCLLCSAMPFLNDGYYAGSFLFFPVAVPILLLRQSQFICPALPCQQDQQQRDGNIVGVCLVLCIIVIEQRTKDTPQNSLAAVWTCKGIWRPPPVGQRQQRSKSVRRVKRRRHIIQGKEGGGGRSRRASRGEFYSKWQSLVVNRVRHPQKNIIYAIGHTKSYYSTAAPLAKPPPPSPLPSPEYCCSDPSHSLSPARSFSIVLHARHSLFSGPYRFRDEFLGGLLHIYYVCLCASFILFSRLGNSCLCLWSLLLLLLAFTTVQPAKTKKEYI